MKAVQRSAAAILAKRWPISSDPSRYYYWWTPKYHSYSADVNGLPVDGHMLVALIAPRPLLLQTGSTDFWSDPKGEFLSVVAAEPVYRLFGDKGPGTTVAPLPGDESMAMNRLGYYMHDGGHAVLPSELETVRLVYEEVLMNKL